MNLRLQPGCKQLKRRGRCAPVGVPTGGVGGVELESPFGRSDSGELALVDSGEEVDVLFSDGADGIEGRWSMSKSLTVDVSFSSQRSCDKPSKNYGFVSTGITY